MAKTSGRNRRRITELIDRDGPECNGCGEIPFMWDMHLPPGAKYATVDHKDPKGGDDPSNLWMMCNSCNTSKGSTPLAQWEKTLDFDGAILRRGFTMVPNVLLENASLTMGARMTLMCLASFAWKGDPFPGQERLGKMLGVTDRTVRDYLSELQREGYLKVSRRGRGRTNVYRIVQTAYLRSSPEDSSAQDAPTPDDDRNPASALDRNPASAPMKKTKDEEDEGKHTARAMTVIPTLTVDRKRATHGEMSLAQGVLREWNEQTGQSLSADGWLRKIIMRCREHPELTPDDHAHLIAKTLAFPWWKGAPTPSVIYGNDTVFDRALIGASQQQASVADIAQAEIDRLRGTR